MKSKRAYLWTAIITMIVIMLASCNKSKDDLPLWLFGLMGGNKTLTALAVKPATANVINGLTKQMTAEGTYDDGTTSDITSQVTWSSSDTAIADIDGTGLLTANGVGSVTITADLSGFSGTAAINVINANLTSITVTPASFSLQKNLTKQLSASGSYDNGSTVDITANVTWTSSNTAVATVNASGLVTGVSAGSADITATLNGVSGTSSATITNPTLTSIAVTPANPTVINGLTRQMTATGTYSDSSTADLTSTATWTSSNTSIATVDSNGLVTGVSSGSVTITASFGGIDGTTTATVVNVTLQSISVTPANPSVGAGMTKQLTATGNYNDSSTADLTSTATWTSSNTSIATVDSNGLVTGVSSGSVTITASFGGIDGTTTVNVMPVQSITINPTNPTLYIGEATGPLVYLTATAVFPDSSTVDITDLADWVSSDTAVVYNAGGILSPSSAGTATITVSWQGASASTTATVVSDLTPPDFSGLNITGTPSGASGEYVAGDVITVSANITEPCGILVDAFGDNQLTFKLTSLNVFSDETCKAVLVSGNTYQCDITLQDIFTSTPKDLSYIEVSTGDNCGNGAIYNLNKDFSISKYSEFFNFSNSVYNQNILFVDRGFGTLTWPPASLSNLTVNASITVLSVTDKYSFVSFDAVSGTSYTVTYEDWTTNSATYTGQTNMSAFYADGSTVFYRLITGTSNSEVITASQTGKIYIQLETSWAGTVGIQVTSP